MDKEFYTELQAALRSYDTKLWQVPALFFTIATLLLINMDSVDEALTFSTKNILLSFFASTALLLLILLHNKATIFHISIQKKINEFDNLHNKNNSGGVQRMPLTSMNNSELALRLRELARKDLEETPTNEGATFSSTRQNLAMLRISNFILYSMILVFFLTAIFFVTALSYWVILPAIQCK